MSWTGYFRTEQVASKSGSGYSFTTTSINNSLENTCRHSIWFTLRLCHSSVLVDQVYYLHDDAPTEPATDGLISSTVYGGPYVEYSVTGNPPGYIKSFTSETGFFSSNQDFSKHYVKWKIKYFAKYSGTLDSGHTAFIKFEFYKRDSSNNDTFLFSVKDGISTLTPLDGTEQTFSPSGSVTTSDRLRIRVYISSEVPT